MKLNDMYQQLRILSAGRKAVRHVQQKQGGCVLAVISMLTELPLEVLEQAVVEAKLERGATDWELDGETLLAILTGLGFTYELPVNTDLAQVEEQRRRHPIVMAVACPDSERFHCVLLMDNIVHDPALPSPLPYHEAQKHWKDITAICVITSSLLANPMPLDGDRLFPAKWRERGRWILSCGAGLSAIYTVMYVASGGIDWFTTIINAGGGLFIEGAKALIIFAFLQSIRKRRPLYQKSGLFVIFLAVEAASFMFTAAFDEYQQRHTNERTAFARQQQDTQRKRQENQDALALATTTQSLEREKTLGKTLNQANGDLNVARRALKRASEAGEDTRDAQAEVDRLSKQVADLRASLAQAPKENATAPIVPAITAAPVQDANQEAVFSGSAEAFTRSMTEQPGMSEEQKAEAARIFARRFNLGKGALIEVLCVTLFILCLEFPEGEAEAATATAYRRRPGGYALPSPAQLFAGLRMAGHADGLGQWKKAPVPVPSPAPVARPKTMQWEQSASLARTPAPLMRVTLGDCASVSATQRAEQAAQRAQEEERAAAQRERDAQRAEEAAQRAQEEERAAAQRAAQAAQRAEQAERAAAERAEQAAQRAAAAERAAAQRTEDAQRAAAERAEQAKRAEDAQRAAAERAEEAVRAEEAARRAEEAARAEETARRAQESQDAQRAAAQRKGDIAQRYAEAKAAPSGASVACPVCTTPFIKSRATQAVCTTYGRKCRDEVRNVLRSEISE